MATLSSAMPGPASAGPLSPAPAGRGYDANFLEVAVPAPQLTAEGRRHAVGAATGQEVVPHTHFSLVMHAQRRLALWVGWNIDGSRLHRLGRRGLAFGPDPLVAPQYQTSEALYANNRLDRGHLARRADLCWGSPDEARQANRDSFYFTNITPQLENFNQSQQGGIWGQLEDALFDQVEVQALRVSVFGGPVLHTQDQLYRGVQLPREFFKVLAYVEAGQLRAQAFLLTQNLESLQYVDLEQFRVYQVTLAELEARCAFRFAQVLQAADRYAEHLADQHLLAAERPWLATLADVWW